jgi:hypothetical protein
MGLDIHSEISRGCGEPGVRGSVGAPADAVRAVVVCQPARRGTCSFRRPDHQGSDPAGAHSYAQRSTVVRWSICSICCPLFLVHGRRARGGTVAVRARRAAGESRRSGAEDAAWDTRAGRRGGECRGQGATGVRGASRAGQGGRSGRRRSVEAGGVRYAACVCWDL